MIIAEAVKINEKFKKTIIQRYNISTGNLSMIAGGEMGLLIKNLTDKNAGIDLQNKIKKGYNLECLIYKNRDELHER